MPDPSWITGILIFGLTVKCIGFAVRDEIWLRGLILIGLVCDVIFYSMRAEPVLQSIMANLLLMTVNLVLITLILVERTTWNLSDQDRRIYAHLPTLTPGQFRKLRKIMRSESVRPGTRLIEEGQPVKDLVLILAKRLDVEKAGKTYPASGPSFVGEIALLTGKLSSASIILPEGGEIVRFPMAMLKAQMVRWPSLSNAIVAVFSEELAMKVVEGAPRPDATPRAEPAM